MCEANISAEEREEQFIDKLYETLDNANLKQKDVDDLKAVILHSHSQNYGGANEIPITIKVISALNDYVRDNL